jgi:formylglycine-generating enzyme required for sulfatase activity
MLTSGSNFPNNKGGNENPSFLFVFFILVSLVISVMSGQVAYGASSQSSPSGISIFRDCPDCPEMVSIPAGSYSMGSSDSDTIRDLDAVTGKYPVFSKRAAGAAFATEHPQHSVSVSAFALGRYSVTKREFSVFVREANYAADGKCTTFIKEQDDFVDLAGSGWQNPGLAQTDDDPVVCVSWNDAQAYIKWLNGKISNKQSVEKDQVLYRLPSEAEREFAARAGTSSAWWWGNAIGDGNANCSACGTAWDYTRTAPVGSLKPNQFGLYQMAGNIFEWTEDCWNPNYQNAPPDGSAWNNGDCSRRVARGGSWFSAPFATRSSGRTAFTTKERANYLGFRLARSIVRSSSSEQ